ncbi:MAG: hypothetical protein A2V63_04785 [Candidatus Eisenbacteria bacterium RBG_19FT_COMBO_70_11]|nr:MAG: hypothetical protein A2V63_04785 [Candidatus Eisenbacteria bacterium RBG_19FT_COMBO_70_11]
MPSYRTSPSTAQRRVALAILLLGLLALAVAANAMLLVLAASAAERFRLEGPRVEIYNLAGTAELVRGSGSAVEVELTRGGADAGRLRIETGPIGEARTLRVLYPGNRVIYGSARWGWGSNTEVGVGEDGRFGSGFGREALRSRRRVRIASRGSGLDAHADLVIRVPKGVRLAVHLAVGQVEATDVEADLLLDTAAAPVTTSHTRGPLAIDVGSGAVRVSGAEGPLSVDTGSGSVRVEDVRGNQVSLDTGSGSVAVSGVVAERLLVDTGSGSVTLEAVRAPEVRVDTGSGGVRAEIAGEVRSLVVDTGSGSVTVRVPTRIDAEVELESGSGGIHTDLPLTDVRRGDSSLRGRLGEGRGRIRIDTGSGSVRLLSG